MAGAKDRRTAYVDRASARFREAWQRIAHRIATVFPKAEATFAYDLPGWRVPLARGVEPQTRTGTIDTSAAWVLMADRKQGPVLHVWNPVDYEFLDRFATRLKPHGLKTMRGCIQYARKAPYPDEVVEEVLRVLKEDVTGPASKRPSKALK